VFLSILRDLAHSFQGLTIPGRITHLVCFSSRDKCKEFVVELKERAIKHNPITSRCVEVWEDNK
jgi:hypothetical protein